MCFAIPYRILEKKSRHVIIEDGRKITLGHELNANVGDFVQVIGNVAVATLTKTKGQQIRKLIKSLA